MKYFEKTNFKNLSDEYIAQVIETNQNKIRIDLNFENKNPSDDELETFSGFLFQLENIIQQNEIRIQKDFESPEENTVREYISHHLNEIPKIEINKFINKNDKTKSDKEKLFQKLKLVRIGIYPLENSYYSIFDYTIGENYTQYLISIQIDKTGKIIDITMES